MNKITVQFFVFGVIEQQIFYVQALSELAGILDGRMVLFVRIKDGGLRIQAERLV